MQTILPSEFKRGMALMLDGAPQIIDDFHTAGTAQTKHKLHVRLRNLLSGRITDRIFAENERVPLAELSTHTVQFSYQQAGSYVFIDTRTYEEFTLPAEKVGDRRWFLKENEECSAYVLGPTLLDLILPSSLPLKVVETAPPQKGGSDAAWKEARLETGLQIMVPLFIAAGDTVRVDTQTRKYAGKEN